MPVDRRVGIGFVRPATVRPAAGVWASVDSRPVPPAFARFAGFGEVGFADPLLLNVRFADLLFFELFVADLAERPEPRFFGALARRAFLRFGAAFFFAGAFLPRFAFRAAFFAIVGLLSPA